MERGLIKYGNIESIKNNVPSTLSINRESRAAAQKEFAIVPIRQHGFEIPGEYVRHNFARVPICVRLNTDTVGFSPSEDLTEWLEHAMKATPRLFENVGKLTLRCSFFYTGEGLLTWEVGHWESKWLLDLFEELAVLVLVVNGCDIFFGYYSWWTFHMILVTPPSQFSASISLTNIND